MTTPNKIPSREAIGMAVRAAREAAGLTLRDLAAVTSISHALLGRTELGERDLGYAEMLSIAIAVNATEQTLREFAMTFQRDGIQEARQQMRDLNKAQRRAIEALISHDNGMPVLDEGAGRPAPRKA